MAYTRELREALQALEAQVPRLAYGAWVRHAEHLHAMAEGYGCRCGCCVGIWWRILRGGKQERGSARGTR